MQMNLTVEEKAFLLHVLNNRVTHPNKLGWVNPLDKDMVFEHQDMVQLLNKIQNI